MSTRCLRCQYLRDGLAADAQCPECGEPAPPPDWVVVHGRSISAPPTWLFSLGIVMVCASLAPAYFAWRMRQWGPLVQAAMLVGFGATVLVRAAVLSRRVHEGGDVAWVLRPEGLEVRTAFGQSLQPWTSLEWAHFERGFSSHSVRLSYTPRGVVNTNAVHGIWVDQRQVDARAIHAELSQRIRRASQAPPTVPT